MDYRRRGRAYPELLARRQRPSESPVDLGGRQRRSGRAVNTSDFSRFRHRRSYTATPGRDRWTVERVAEWINRTLPSVLAASPASAAVLDVGCGEQPFRSLVERSGRRYVGMDVVQNSAGTVDILSSLEDAPQVKTPFASVLCTEVLEHVSDLDAAVAGLRRLVADGGRVVLTVPFVFPLHMEPYDFRRLTTHGVAQVASAHGFEQESSERLGDGTDVLATIVSDLSILPAAATMAARLKVRACRMLASAAIRVLGSATAKRHLAINSNLYLSNGVILRATCSRTP